MRSRRALERVDVWLLILALAGIVFGSLLTFGPRVVALLPGSPENHGSFPPDGSLAGLPDSPSRASRSVDEEAWRIQDETNTIEVFEKASRGVVMVSTRTRAGSGLSGSGSREDSRKGNGSGFFIDSQGHVVTNYHVIEDASSIVVHTFDGSSYGASVAGSDRLTDLAVLKVNVLSDQIHPLSLADYSSVKVGQKAIVIGSPLATGSRLGLDRSPTITAGVISAKDRSLPVESLNKPGVNDFIIENLIQTDAAVNPGNSGGPLLNSRGEVVGVITAIIDSARGIGFAIPCSVVREVVPAILQHGSMKRAYMGISYLGLDDLSRSMGDDFINLGIGVPEGALVTEVEPDGPAQKAGLMGSDREVTVNGQVFRVGGDVIVSINGVKIRGTDLTEEILKYSPGQKIAVEVWRGGRNVALDIVLGWR